MDCSIPQKVSLAGAPPWCLHGILYGHTVWELHFLPRSTSHLWPETFGVDAWHLLTAMQSVL
jgi:hypothetical protein